MYSKKDFKFHSNFRFGIFGRIYSRPKSQSGNYWKFQISRCNKLIINSLHLEI